MGDPPASGAAAGEVRLPIAYEEDGFGFYREGGQFLQDAVSMQIDRLRVVCDHAG